MGQTMKFILFAPDFSGFEAHGGKKSPFLIPVPESLLEIIVEVAYII